ncbi:MAG: hypothetical protein F6K14_30310 [Symploca sp. SIO2C1]|nr:hypothetical protein [Symploca sp. SIO2C1]
MTISLLGLEQKLEPVKGRDPQYVEADKSVVFYSTPSDNKSHNLDGCAVPILNGCAVPILDGCAVPILDGCAVPILDGCAVPILDGCAVPISDSQLFPRSGTMKIYDFEGDKHKPEEIGTMPFNKGDNVYDKAWEAYTKVMEARGQTLKQKPAPSDLHLAFPPST